jgi:hypothetical protein
MKYIVIFTAALFLTLLISNDTAYSQKGTTVNQVIICNGGYFGNPDDYVTIESYNPVNQAVTLFGTIYTQSVQDVLIDGHYAYVAAQDSIVKYDIDTYARVAAVADSGTSRLGIYNNMLIVTKQYPIVRFRVEILNATNLALLGSVQNISGDCGSVTVYGDSVYVAVNGGYMGMDGRLAVINPANWTLVREINFGPPAIGITDLYNYNGYIYSVNKTPYGGGTGSITKYNPYTGTFSTKVDTAIYGNGVGINGTLLYLVYNYGIGSYNLNTDAIADTAIISDPGSANHIYILAARLDFVNNYFYMNLGNESTFGVGVVGTTAGDSITSFTEGIAADCLAIDFRTPAGIQPSESQESMKIVPNPVSDWMSVNFGNADVSRITVSDVTGRTQISRDILAGERSVRVNCSILPSGVYFLSAKTDRGQLVKKFIKR